MLLVGLLTVAIAVQSVFIAKLYRQNQVPEADADSAPLQIDLQPKTTAPPSVSGGSSGGSFLPPSWQPHGGLGLDPDVWDPFQEFRNMHQQMDQLFNDSFGRFQLSPDFQSLWGGTTFSPSMDVEEQKGQYVVRMDIPGTDKSNISVDINDRKLTVSGKINEMVEEKGQNQLRKERRSGEFSRSMQLPGPVKSDEMEAEYKNGVLVITLPKAEEEHTRQSIQVK
jgi:HSP20 family protein